MSVLDTIVGALRALFQSAQARDADLARRRREWAERTRAELHRDDAAISTAEDDLKHARANARDVERDIR